MMSKAPVPKEILLNKQSDTLIVTFDTKRFPMSAEYLRVCSPSAEVRAHGGDWHIIAGKKGVTIKDVVPVGNYAIRLIFSDGHSSGLYSWDILYDLVHNHSYYWQRYLTALKNEAKSRES